MSIDDQLYSDDKHIVSKLDNLIYFNFKKLAEKYQNKTGRSKKDLETALYSVSAASYTAWSVHNKFPIGLILTYHGVLKAKNKQERPKEMSPKEADIKLEAKGGYLRLYKSITLFGFGFSLYEIVSGLAYTVSGGISGDQETLKAGISGITFGVGLFCLMSADYISQIKMPDPPPKKVKVSVMERIRNSLRQPQFEYSGMDGYK